LRVPLNQSRYAPIQNLFASIVLFIRLYSPRCTTLALATPARGWWTEPRLQVSSPSPTPSGRSREMADSEPAAQPAIAKAKMATTAKAPPTACNGYSRSPKNRQAMATLTPGARAIRAVTTAAEPLR